jgi:serine/threonine protein kinase
MARRFTLPPLLVSDKTNPCDDILKKMVSETSKIHDKCTTNSKPIIGTGAFGTVSDNSDGTVTKFSEGFKQLRNEMDKHGCTPDNVGDMEDRFNDLNNEIVQNDIFSALNEIFPKNIVKFYKNKSQYCKTSHDTNNITEKATELIFNKIEGMTLHEYLKTIPSYYDVILLVIQLLYILCYSNIQGIFHNDLNSGNIIVSTIYNNNKLDGIKLGGIDILYNLEDNNFIPVPVLIDFTFSKKIIDKNKIPVEMSIIMETIDNILKQESIDLGSSTNTFLQTVIDYTTELFPLPQGRDLVASISFYKDLPILEKNKQDLLLELFKYLMDELEIVKPKSDTENMQYGGDKYYNKYMKYKMKYLSMKNN